MKLIKEAVKEHSRKLNLSLEARDNICREDFEKSFIEGIEFAQRFISVNDELPEDIETDGRTYIPCIVTNGQTKTIAFRRLSPLTKKWNWRKTMYCRRNRCFSTKHRKTMIFTCC